MSTSSVHAPAKKDGAGGAYTWGTAADVTDYEPVGLGGATQVTLAPSPAAAAPSAVPTNGAEQQQVVISNLQQFPTLGQGASATVAAAGTWGTGSPTAAAAVRTAPAFVAHAAPAVVLKAVPPQVVSMTQPAQLRATTAPLAPPPVVAVAITEEEWQLVQNHRKARSSAGGTEAPPAAGQAEPEQILAVVQPTPTLPARIQEAVRSNVTFDAQHPRNVFARKPHVAAGGGAVEQQPGPPLTIDWSGAGNLAFQTQVIHAAAANPAHLAVNAVVRPGPTLSDLRARPSVAAEIPKLSKQQMGVGTAPKFAKPQVIMQRKC